MDYTTSWYHTHHICVTRSQWVKLEVCVIQTIYATSGLNGLSDGLVSSQPYASSGRSELKDEWVLYPSPGLNVLSEGLVSSRPYVRHQASMG